MIEDEDEEPPLFVFVEARIFPTEDITIVSEAMTNLLGEVELKVDERSSGKYLIGGPYPPETLSILYLKIRQQKTITALRRRLLNNIDGETTFAYFNKQVLVVKSLRLVEELNHSPLEGVTLSLQARNEILPWIDWLAPETVDGKIVTPTSWRGMPDDYQTKRKGPTLITKKDRLVTLDE